MLHITTSSDPAYIEANAQPMVMYRNLLAEGTVADSGLPGDSPRANAYSGSTFDFWKPASVPATLRASFGAVQSADGAFFAAHNLATVGGTVTVQYYDGTTWQTQSTVTPTTNQPFGMIWPARSATGWGVQVSGGLAEIGVAWIGPRLVIPGGVKPGYVPVWAAQRIEKTNGTSRRGHFFAQAIERAGAELSPEFMDLPYSFGLTDLAGFATHYREGNPFVWASAPSVFPEDAAYVWSDAEQLAMPIRAGGDWVGLSLQMQAYVEP